MNTFADVLPRINRFPACEWSATAVTDSILRTSGRLGYSGRALSAGLGEVHRTSREPAFDIMAAEAVAQRGLRHPHLRAKSFVPSSPKQHCSRTEAAAAPEGRETTCIETRLNSDVTVVSSTTTSTWPACAAPGDPKPSDGIWPSSS